MAERSPVPLVQPAISPYSKGFLPIVRISFYTGISFYSMLASGDPTGNLSNRGSLPCEVVIRIVGRSCAAWLVREGSVGQQLRPSPQTGCREVWEVRGLWPSYVAGSLP